MNRPWKIWSLFAVCAAVLLGVMAWVSWTALRLDHAQAQAQAQAELEENVRLALWRMDSILAPLMSQESARPYFVYSAFYPEERAYGKMFNALSSGEVLVPSPLLTQISSNILLHFQFDPRGLLTSPEVPVGNQRDLAEAQFTTHEHIEEAATRLKEFERIMAQQAPPELVHLLKHEPNQTETKTQAPRNDQVLLAVAPVPQANENVLSSNAVPVLNSALQQQLQLPQQRVAQQAAQQPSKSAQQQYTRSGEELQARAQSVQQAFDLNVKNAFANLGSPVRAKVAEGLFKPLWFGDKLVLVRRVAVQGREYVQGCWLDWPALRQSLLDAVKDLLPAARLEPIANNGADQRARLLASLPVHLSPGRVAAIPNSLASPILFALVLGWICVLVAVVAVALLLQGTLSLSERRAAFVSAVTHELRTPLTTFKMYSEMLATGMVADEAKQRNYLATLCAEANRLNHLIENVLAYARLERGSARRRIEKVTLRDLIERVKPRLVQRAEQAGLSLQEDAEERALDTIVQVDVAVVEQILFNLVDNACKYAAPAAEEKIIHLEAVPENGKFAMLRVRDHGQGISADVAKRLFRPFSKSAHEAARTAPGVGLGLALCRRLSRSLGGDLRYDISAAGGACFELLLPAGGA